MLKTLSRLIGVGFIFLALCLPAIAITFDTYLTEKTVDNIPDSKPAEHFDCSDKIYAVIEVTEDQNQETSGSNDHILMVNWYNPGNKIEQKTRYEFKSYGKGTRLWAWLRLSGPTGAAIGRIFDPAFGMGEFIGKWRAEILIDNKKVKIHHFDVLC